MSETVTKTDLLSMNVAELEEFCRSIGEPKFRAGQIFKWMHAGVGFDGMSNLSKALREKLNETAVLLYPEIAEKLFITRATAKAHVHSILQKLYVDDRTQAAVTAMREGLV